MFESARLKLKRADKHVGDLRKALAQFIDTHPPSFDFKDNLETGGTFQVRFGEAIPTDFSLMLGDAVHNLRTALDHATWELIGIDGGTQDSSTQFLSGKTQVDYEAMCNGLRTPCDDTKNFFISLAVYPGGAGEKLYGLNRLDIADKHKVLTPVIGITTVDHLKFIKPDGKVQMTIDNCSFRMGPDGCAGLVGVLGRGFSVQFDQDAKATLGVFFGKVEFFQSLPLIETLVELSDAVADTIRRFEKLIETRH